MIKTRVLKVCEKDPDERLDYGFTWTAWLATAGDVIADATWTIPDDLTLELETISTTETAVWLSGGTEGEEHVIVCQIETDSDPPRIAKRSMLIKMVDKGE